MTTGSQHPGYSHRLFIAFDRKATRISVNGWHRWATEILCATMASDNKRELSKTPGCKSRCRRFESCRGHRCLRSSDGVSDLDHVLKCNVLCISADRFKPFNEVYKRFFPKNPPARIFFCVPEWTGPFDVEVDCIAVTKD
jgi:hypothetical protein